MKPIRLFLSLVCGAVAATGMAQSLPDGSVTVSDLLVEKNGNYMAVQMHVCLDSLQVERNRAVLLTPGLVHSDDRRDLPAIGIYGRNRYYHYVRNGESMLSGAGETVIRAKHKPAQVTYQQILPYEPWMDGAQLVLLRQDYGCCGDILAEQSGVLLEAFHQEAPGFRPAYVYVRPAVETVKTRALDKSAYIDFPVSRTDIRPDYRNNRAELDKILATIDSVKADADVRLTALSIKGHASPEGSYANNERLARSRTEALRKYVTGLYHFPDTFVRTSYEPENWEGLRAYVSSSALEHKDEILQLIDSDLQPDAKEQRIRTAYPADYAHLLRVCYPALRRSDYRVEYVVRSYTDVEEIKRVLRTQPQKLSLEEFYMAAQTMEPGSEAFNEVFETAVRMYPDDAVANLNAANSAMQRNDLASAARYLAKAGTSPQAVYARGTYAALQGDYAQARALFEEAATAGLPEASQALQQLKMINQ